MRCSIEVRTEDAERSAVPIAKEQRLNNVNSVRSLLLSSLGSTKAFLLHPERGILMI